MEREREKLIHTKAYIIIDIATDKGGLSKSNRVEAIVEIKLFEKKATKINTS